MKQQDVDDRLATAVEAARAAGAVALGHVHDLASLTIEHKGEQDLVSEADRQSEDTIRTILKRAFPDDAFVGEESGAEPIAPDQGAWVVDPIDGTQPFLLGLPTWCVSIAYVRDGRVQVGVVLNPATDDLYTARRGAGATWNGRPMHVRNATSLAEGLTGMGCSARTTPAEIGLIAESLRARGGMYHRIGSGALSLAYVAAGHLIGYLEPYMNAWDCLAAILLVEESGGRVSPFLHDHGITGGGSIVAATPGVYDALLDLLPPT